MELEELLKLHARTLVQLARASSIAEKMVLDRKLTALWNQITARAVSTDITEEEFAALDAHMERISRR